MKKIFFLLIGLFFTSTVFSQNWTKNLPQGKSKGELTFYDYRNAFNTYWEPYQVDKGYYFENGVKKKAKGWKQFKRWEYEMERKINPSTGEFPAISAQLIYEEYLETNPADRSPLSANWTSSGPLSSSGGYAGIGRINCIAFHPTDNNTYWVGTASGGLWVTTNNGSNWTCLTDNNGVLAVSDIVIPTDFATSNTIYIATGDKDHWDNRSVGVLKSTNGGSTWNTTGISYSLSDGQMVNRLLVDPANNQLIIAATSSGVYKTTDGGTNWNTQLSTVGFIDMEYKSGDFNSLYGSTQDGKIYFSTNGGTSWTETFNDASAYRIELAVSANQPTWLYALTVNSLSGLYGLYKSINSGSTFSQVLDGATLNLLGWDSNGGDSGGQGWYDLSLAASPSNANTLLVGGVNTWRSVNGGTTWSIVNHWSGDGVPAAHADKHNLSFRANGDLFECNDGGIYYSNNNGTNWTDKSNGMIISQMYKLGVSATVSSEVITGLQDNGTKLLSGGTWSDVKGGDGMECLIDYTNANTQYGTYVNGQISRTMNHWSSSTDIQPLAAGDGAWVTPYIIDPNNPLILYAGYADVWKTTNRGDNWTKISTMNTASKIRSMAIAPTNTQVLYAAAPSNIWKTTNGGTSWTEITGTLPVGSGNITYVTVHENDANTLWVTLGGYNATTVYRSTNGGTTWSNISTGLPEIPAYCVVQNKQSSSIDQLYVGTELGVFFKNGSDNWVAFNTGLPNVQIGELEIYYAANPQESKLKAATYGRGLWETPVHYSAVPMTYISGTTTQTNVSSVAPNQINQEIIGIQIVTNGNLSPLSVTSFTLNTIGSTNPLTDITNAKLFYTGTNSSFSATAQFGITSDAPDGVFTIIGDQVLSEGVNHFWLTYDVPLTAVFDNYLDAQCTSFSVTTAISPSVSNPAGSRLIGISYCDAGSINCDEHISNVNIGIINNTSTCTEGGYANYNSISTDISQGSSIPITITNGMPFIGDQCGIWVDWNNNGDFTDDDVITVAGNSGGGPYTASITCPIDALLGTRIMRIRIHYTEEATSPCGTAVYGEVEDYTLNIVPPTYCSAGSSLCDEYISNVTIGTINNTTSCSTGGYSNFTSVTTDLVEGSTLPITVTNGRPFIDDHCGIWVDWNNNLDFTDDPPISIIGTPGGGPYTANIVCPADAIAGTKRMRIRIHYTEEATSPCGTSVYGEVEDYSLNVIPLGHIVSGRLGYNNTPNTAIDSMWVHLRLNDAIIDSVMTDLSGHYSIPEIYNGTYTITGRSGKPLSGVNGTDALKIQRHFAGLEALTEPIRLLAADVNISSSINGTDAVQVKRRFAGMDATFERGDWTFAKPLVGGNTIIISGTDVSQDFYGLCVGDVNGSGIPLPGSSFNTSVYISQNEFIETIPGQEFELAVKVGEAMNVNAISLVFLFPSDLLEVIDVKTTIGNPTFTTNNNQIRIAWSEMQTLSLQTGDALMILKLKATDRFTGDLSVNFATTDESELADEFGNIIPNVELIIPTLKPLNQTGIDDQHSILTAFNIFPNPADEKLNIAVKVSKKTTLDIEITDMLGRIIIRNQMGDLSSGMNTFQINTNGLPSGIYSVKLILDSERLFIHKLLITR
ncbi:MAG: GEVED domain-containing protein [Bacteroidales bacterium]